jgi:3-oxoacyl-[acyl-carrier protein] reductase
MSDARRTSRVVLVTGAAHGIGEGISEAFARNGDTVVLSDINSGEAERLAKEFAAEFNVPTLGVRLDVRDVNSVTSTVEKVLSPFGRIDILVNNAGIYPNTPMLEMSEAEWDAVFDTNVKGIFLVTQAVAASMVARGIKGNIINISSGAGISGRAGASHYCSTKAAVNMFTRVVAIELGPYNICVNAIAPGLIEVPDADLTPEYVGAIVNAMPARRIGQPSDIANGALFLASPASSFITGSIMSIDGGSSAGRSLPLSSKKRAAASPEPASTTADN